MNDFIFLRRIEFYWLLSFYGELHEGFDKFEIRLKFFFLK